MKIKAILYSFLFLTFIGIFQTTQAGLAAAVIVQRTIVNQCILQAQPGPADMQSLVKLYGQESAPYLYVNGLKIFNVKVEFENQGEIVSYSCAEFFPELAQIHFYRGNWDEVLANLEKEVERLRKSGANNYGKHVTLR